MKYNENSSITLLIVKLRIILAIKLSLLAISCMIIGELAIYSPVVTIYRVFHDFRA